MTVRIAYVEEPPFYWTDRAGAAVGADVELARAVIGAIGHDVEFVPTTFDRLLDGVATGMWDMNVPIFITAERKERVRFSRPVWNLGDGFLVLAGNPKELLTYSSIRKNSSARLGVIPGQVQYAAALEAGVPRPQLVEFSSQPEALAALVAGGVDAFAATAVGNRAIVADRSDLAAVPFDGLGAQGGFSFATTNGSLAELVDSELARYLGTDDHRTRVAPFGITAAEIDPTL